MKNVFFYGMLLLAASTSVAAQQDPAKLIEQVMLANGSVEQLRKLNNVSLEYTFRDVASGKTDVSVERYIFDGEHSFAHYLRREMYTAPDRRGIYTQHYDGSQTKTLLAGKVLTEQDAYVGHFLRKTNFYWFTMMFKLNDPGVNHRQLADRTVDGTKYHVVEMTFGENVGETDDRYLLYINPRTHLIDQFLFTVKGFGITDPMLMRLQYEEIDGLQLSTYRKYAPANWEGEIVKDAWTEQITRNIRFSNGFTHQNITSNFIEDRVALKQRIELPAAQVWNKLKDFRVLAQLVPQAITSVELDENNDLTKWKLHLPNGNTINEEVTHFDPVNFAISYKMTNTPMPIRDYLATISVKPLGQNSCLVSFQADFAAKPAQRADLNMRFKQFQRTYLDNIPTLFSR